MPTSGAGSPSESTAVMASNESATAPRTVLDELERRIILIEQALVGLETAWFTFWDGDTGEVSGPLHKSQPNFRAMPAVSKALGRQWHEEQGNKAAVELIRFLMRLRKADLWPWKGLLHRRDGLAVVFGLERPTFVLTGAVTEVASEAFSEVLSEGEVVMTEAFLKQFPTELAWKTFGRRDERRSRLDDTCITDDIGSSLFTSALTNPSAPTTAAGSNSTAERLKTSRSSRSASLEFNSLLEELGDSAKADPGASSGVTVLPMYLSLNYRPARAESTAIVEDDPLNPSRPFWNNLGFDLGPLRTARLTKNGFLRVRTLRDMKTSKR
jgi:hypothetical protein